jgi:hypothetical protein
LSDFIVDYKRRYPAIPANYSELHQDFYQVEGTDCFLCPEVETCRVCPINAAYGTGSLGKISCRKWQLLKKEKNTRNLLLIPQKSMQKKQGFETLSSKKEK